MHKASFIAMAVLCLFLLGCESEETDDSADTTADTAVVEE